MATYGRETWLDVGLRLLAQRGHTGLTIAALCAEAGKTRGSFYHHFCDQEAFFDAMLERWRLRDTEAVLAAAAASAGPGLPALEDRMTALARTMDHALERAIRRWSALDPRVAAIQERVDRRRFAALVGLHHQAGVGDGETAEALALLELSVLVGFQMLEPGAKPAVRDRLRTLVTQATRAARSQARTDAGS